jgi:hypothetical protein
VSLDRVRRGRLEDMANGFRYRSLHKTATRHHDTENRTQINRNNCSPPTRPETLPGMPEGNRPSRQPSGFLSPWIYAFTTATSASAQSSDGNSSGSRGKDRAIVSATRTGPWSHPSAGIILGSEFDGPTGRLRIPDRRERNAAPAEEGHEALNIPSADATDAAEKLALKKPAAEAENRGGAN